MKIRVVVFALLTLLPSIQEMGFGQKVGTTSLQFLKVMPVARGAAMGDAYVTLASGADALFWNPAGLSNTEMQEISTTLTLWLFDTKQSAIGYALPLGNFGALGLQLQYVDFGDIVETNVYQLGRVGDPSNPSYNPGLTGRTFSPKSYLIGVSYARQFTTRFSSGVSVKYAKESLYDSPNAVVYTPDNPAGETFKTHAEVLLFDFGIHYNTGYRTIQLAAAIQNLGTPVTFAREHYDAPLTFRLGSAADLIGTDALLGSDPTNRLTLSYDMIQPNDYTQQMQVGMEYAYTTLVSFRGGYKFNYDYDGLTLGAGIQTDLAGMNLAFDYSYGTMGDYLPKVHRLSLGIKLK